MKNRTILLVDDEEIILNSIGADLRHAQFTVTLAQNGAEAIRLLQETHFDMVVTDLAMPGTDGIQLLQETKKINPQTNVIILTGFGDMTSAIDALRSGADDYLIKPCESEELIFRINRCLEKQNLLENLKEQHAKLAESEMKKTLLLDSTAEGIYGLDLEGRTTFMNPAAQQMLGYTLEEIIDKNNHSLIHHTKSDGSPYPIEECQIIAAIKRKQKFSATDEIFWRKDGTSFPVDYSSTPIRHNGEVVGAVIIFSDISSKKEQAEHALQLQKFQSLNSMAAGIAHNFNNILMAVIGNQELALESMPPHLKERSYIESAFKASQRAAKISTMMLQFIGQAKLEMQYIKVPELISDILEIIQPQIPSHIELSIKGDENLTVKCDLPMMQQVLVNLITNAVEAIGEERGEICLQYGQNYYPEEQLNQPHMQAKLRAGDYVYFMVSDTGPGMSAEQIRRAFEPFFSTKFTGRGMGLATVLGCMRTHNGTILLNNAPVKGLNATVLFPALEQKSVPVDTHVRPRPILQKCFSGTVLLVDDEEVLLDIGQELLQVLGFTVLAAKDGFEALDLFEKNEKTIKLVLLDVAMPKISGIEILERIREKSMVPVILDTGFRIERLVDKVDDIANVGLLQKPFTIQQLTDAIKHLLNHDQPPHNN